MHAADAVHGDLGMIQPEDVILCLSKSGETQEIKLLLPMLRQRGTCIIGMAANAQSYLATCADYCLLTPTPQEADPNNLAPTASTTAQMALGDAMATALLALRGFSPEDFARIHPGGSLGKQLYLRVSDLFPNNEKPTVHPQDSLRRTILEMTSKRLGATAVVDEQGALCGIITDGDLRRMLESERDWTGLRAEDIMTRQPKCIAPQALAVKALEMMRHYSITSLVVAEGSRYYGFVHLHDLLREGII